MKKVFLLGCILIFALCAPKKTQVKTQGLEEVVVYGEETEGNKETVATEPVLPTPSEETTTAPPIAETTSPPAEGENVVPPPAEETTILPPVEEETPVPPAGEEVITASPTVPAPPAVPSPTKPVKVLGFRVQLFASSTQKNAERVADDARNTFKEHIYVEYAAPYYKVHVGDCLTREEAQVLKNKALSLGYRGAFVVETTISP